MVPELKGTPEGKEEILYNKGAEEFNKVLISPDATPEPDDVLRHLSLLSLHDACYNISAMTYDGRPNHPSLYPVAMKDAYNLSGEGSMYYTIVEEYIFLDIGKYTLLTLTDWMGLTFSEQRMIKKLVEKKKNLELKLSDEITNELKEHQDTQKQKK